MTTEARLDSPSEPDRSEFDATAASIPSTARRSRRRRRPSGAPPPLPRSIGLTGKLWLAAMGVLTLWAVVAHLFHSVDRFTDRTDSAILRQIARLRTDWLTDVMNGIDRVGSGWAMTRRGLGLIVALMVFRRWRHLFTFLGSVVVARGARPDPATPTFARPRPYDVTIIGRWAGYSLPVAAGGRRVTFIVVGIIYTLVVPGPPAHDRQGGRRGRGRRSVSSPRLYLGRRPPLRRPGRRRARRRDPAQRLPLLHAERGLPGHATGGARPRTSTSAAGGARRSGRPSQDQLGVTVRRHQAGRPGRLGRLDAAAAPRRRRPRHLPVREALRDEPRAGRPLVQARPHDPLRAARGRGAVPVRPPARRSTRTTRCGCCATSGIPTAAPLRHRRADARARVPARHRVLRRRRGDRRRRGRRRASSTRASRSSAGCGTPASPTATSSRPTCWSRDGHAACSSTSPSSRCARRRGARRSTSPT